MINLLPYDENKQTRAARTNLILLRYIVFLGLAVGFLVLACATTYFLIGFIKSQDKEITSLEKSISSQTTANSANSLSAKLVTAKSILDQQVSYYSILSEAGAALPTGTILDSLTIDDTTIESPISLKIYSKTADIELKVKENFQRSTIFSNYSSSPASPNPADQSEYKYVLNVTVNINKANMR